jgi:hypothetical protein
MNVAACSVDAAVVDSRSAAAKHRERVVAELMKLSVAGVVISAVTAAHTASRIALSRTSTGMFAFSTLAQKHKQLNSIENPAATCSSNRQRAANVYETILSPNTTSATQCQRFGE